MIVQDVRTFSEAPSEFGADYLASRAIHKIIETTSNVKAWEITLGLSGMKLINL